MPKRLPAEFHIFLRGEEGGYTSNFRFHVLLYFVDHYALISYPICPKSVLNETSVYFQGFCKVDIFPIFSVLGESPGKKNINATTTTF